MRSVATTALASAQAARPRLRNARRVAVAGASGRSGAAFCRALHAAFDAAPMRDRLGIVPVALEGGPASAFGGGRHAA